MGFNTERRQGINNTVQLLNGVGKVSTSGMAYWEKKKAINSTALAAERAVNKLYGTV